MEYIYETIINDTKTVCHFDEIAYFNVNWIGDQYLCSPVLRNGTMLPGQLGGDAMQRYLKYKNDNHGHN
jgi:hypothetical protein